MRNMEKLIPVMILNKVQTSVDLLNNLKILKKLAPKDLLKKIFELKKIGSKNDCGIKKIWVKKNVRSKKMLGQKKFGSKRFLGQKKCWVKKNFGSKKKNFGSKKKFGSKILGPS